MVKQSGSEAEGFLSRQSRIHPDSVGFIQTAGYLIQTNEHDCINVE